MDSGYEMVEVHYTDMKTFHDYSVDIQAETREEAKMFFENEHGSRYSVWGVYSK